LTVQQIDRDTNGLAAVSAAPTSLELSIPNNDGREFIDVRNTGVTMTITVLTPGQVGGLDIAELVATITATTGVHLIGPFPPALFNQSDGSVSVNASVTTTCTVACFRL